MDKLEKIEKRKIANFFQKQGKINPELEIQSSMDDMSYDVCLRFHVSLLELYEIINATKRDIRFAKEVREMMPDLI